MTEGADGVIGEEVWTSREAIVNNTKRCEAEMEKWKRLDAVEDVGRERRDMRRARREEMVRPNGEWNGGNGCTKQTDMIKSKERRGEMTEGSGRGGKGVGREGRTKGVKWRDNSGGGGSGGERKKECIT